MLLWVVRPDVLDFQGVLAVPVDQVGERGRAAALAFEPRCQASEKVLDVTSIALVQAVAAHRREVALKIGDPGSQHVRQLAKVEFPDVLDQVEHRVLDGVIAEVAELTMRRVRGRASMSVIRSSRCHCTDQIGGRCALPLALVMILAVWWPGVRRLKEALPAVVGTRRPAGEQIGSLARRGPAGPP